MGLRVDLPFRATSSRPDASSCRVTPRQWTTTTRSIATNGTLLRYLWMNSPAQPSLPRHLLPPTLEKQLPPMLYPPRLRPQLSSHLRTSSFRFQSTTGRERRFAHATNVTVQSDRATVLTFCPAIIVRRPPTLPLVPTRKLTPSAPPLKGHSFSRPCSYDRPYRGRKVLPHPPAPRAVDLSSETTSDKQPLARSEPKSRHTHPVTSKLSSPPSAMPASQAPRWPSWKGPVKSSP